MDSPEAEIQRAYAEWRRLAEAEGRAIRAGNWGFVGQCQRAIAQLRPMIDRLTNEEPQPGSTSDSLVRKASSRGTILELIELQRRNLHALQERRQKLSAHIEHVTRSGRNLRGIKRSYSAPVAAAWSSYS
jgi:hypothetical protein